MSQSRQPPAASRKPDSELDLAGSRKLEAGSSRFVVATFHPRGAPGDRVRGMAWVGVAGTVPGFERLSVGRYLVTFPDEYAGAALTVTAPRSPGLRIEVTEVGTASFAVDCDEVELPERGSARTRPLDVDLLEVRLTWPEVQV